jgi:hypothetical protein
VPNRAQPIRWGAVAMALAIRVIPNAGRTVIYTLSGRTYNIYEREMPHGILITDDEEATIRAA